MIQKISLLFRRVVSAFFDNFFLFIVTYLVSIFLFPETFIFGEREWTEEQRIAFTYRYYYFIACWWVYYAFLERSRRQGTWAKSMNNLQVTDLHGNRIGLLRATVRHGARLVTLLTCLLGYLTILFTKRNQALHDLLSGTMVVDRHPPEEEFDDSELEIMPIEPPL
ncbi:RDD family protein [Polystyrenella longa]|uniref:RDD family protein n=1 Tax=Polystyrenella longa TaxID=2528007 RepID=A0A518CU84_9PLAN|nr:RDD family protein [Polystyrenella longa]QDU82793.1 RDD family protein [Polystyrenella longa]